ASIYRYNLTLIYLTWCSHSGNFPVILIGYSWSMTKKSRKLVSWGFVIAAGWFLAIAHARGESQNYTAQIQAQETKYRTPEDLLDKIPFLGEIPRTFLMG